MRWALQLIVVCCALGGAAIARAQNVNINDSVAGVLVDAQGVLQAKVFTDPGAVMIRQRLAAAQASLDRELVRYSKLRKVSLNRLEAALKARNGVPTDEMRYLAGLLRVKYVFYYPDSKDIVIAGPAEGWVTNVANRVVGITTGRPVIELQDMVVALRAFPPDGKKTRVVGCSIDPTQQGLANMQQFLRNVGSYATPNDTQYIVNGLQTSLGLQNVTVNGVAPNTHFAQVLVEADYRMKLIGIGLERPPVRVVSYVERANPAEVSRNAMQRWYFVPDYESVRVSKDRMAMELVGDGVKLVGENEVVGAGGTRTATARQSAASSAFTTSFTKKYPELAERSQVYAQLRNLIDMLVAAAYIQQEDFYGQADWTMPLLGSEARFAVQNYNVPKNVATAVNAIWKGRTLMTPVGGGVEIQPLMALAPEKLLSDEQGAVSEVRQEVKPKLAEGQWWWD